MTNGWQRSWLAPLPCSGSRPRYGLLDGPGVDAGPCCGRALASRTRTSARSLPDSSQWAGTRCVKTGCPLSASGRSSSQMAAATAALSGRPGRSIAGLAPPLSRYRRPPGGSRHGCLLSTAPPALLLCRAKSSARVLEQREPAATRTSRVSPLGNEMVAPPHLSMTPPEAEPSDQIQVASDGSSASRSSA